jgi:hypothetical protein
MCHGGEFDWGDVTFALDSGSGMVRVAGGRGMKGAIANEPGLKVAEVLDVHPVDLRRSSGASVLAAAAGARHALESPNWHNGAVTWAVISGNASGEADADHDGPIRAWELRDQAEGAAFRATGGRQKPASRRENWELDSAPVLRAPEGRKP